MNLLKKAFTSWGYQFRAAVKAQDAAEVANLLDQMHVPPEEREMTLLAEEAGRDVLATYFEKVKDKGGWGWMFPPINYCLDKNLFDRVDLMLEAGIDFNRESHGDHPVLRILRRREMALAEDRFFEAEGLTWIEQRRVVSIPSDKEKQWLEKMTASGIELVEGAQDFLLNAIKADDREALDLFVARSINPRTGHEKALRLAAELERGRICRHLIEKHGADVDGVIAEARRLTGCYDVSGNEKNKEYKIMFFLTEVKNSMNLPEPEKLVVKKEPTTLETLSAELKELRTMVAEMTQKVAQLQSPVVRLDKNSHSTPKA